MEMNKGVFKDVPNEGDEYWTAYKASKITEQNGNKFDKFYKIRTGEMAVTASTLRYSNNSYLSILIEYLKVDAVSDHYCQKQ